MSKTANFFGSFSIAALFCCAGFLLPGKNAAAAEPSAEAAAVARARPPVIIVKLDDLRQTGGKANGLWTRVADYLKSRGIKYSIGIIAQTLGEATPEYIGWIRKRHDSGEAEFWFHGWSHGTHEVEGVKYNEFNKRPYEEQKKAFDDSQKLALEKLGFAFAAFGPPGGVFNGSQDENTFKVMAEDPHMKVWLYPQPLDAPGRDLQAAGKLTVLDRVWAVNFESKVGQPDYQKFVEGYAKNPDREYFVLQGHPMQWGTPERWGDFVKIIDFLAAQKAVFMTPSEYAAAKSENP